MIGEFKDRYFFLSNFYMADVIYCGIKYTNNESAFQSAKTEDMDVRLEFANLNPSEAKRKGRRLKLRYDWEEVKFKIMYDICYAKFTQNLSLMHKLINTDNELLEEGNNWGDKIWGVVDGDGENHLGRTLMSIRGRLK